MNGAVPFLPDSASTAAGQLDVLSVALLVIALATLGLVVLLLLTFCVRYRKSRHAADRNLDERKSWVWEISWTTASFVVFVGLYAWGADLYLQENRPPSSAADIYVVGKQWMWKAEHPDGQREINTLHVPVDRPIRLVMTSEDVIHGFYVPAFRLKRDVVPGRYVSLWFTATKPGHYRLFCSQFCGTEHAEMDGEVVVMPEGDFQTWLAANALTGTLASEGGALFRRLGCSGCHAPGATTRAPRLAGLFGRRVALCDGGSAIADEDFIRSAILQPASNPPAGYPTTMPSFAGQVGEEDVVALVAYIKSLAAQGGTP